MSFAPFHSPKKNRWSVACIFGLFFVLKFSFRSGTEFLCNKIRHDVITFSYPGSTSKTHAPNKHVPKQVESKRDVGSPSLSKQKHDGDSQEKGRRDNHPYRKVCGSKDYRHHGVDCPSKGSVATVQFHSLLSNKVQVVEGIRNFAQKHARHRRHVTGTDNTSTDHVKGGHYVMGNEQKVIVGEHERRCLGIPSKPQNIDQGVVNHVPSTQLQQSIGEIGPPLVGFRLVFDLCRYVVSLGPKGDD